MMQCLADGYFILPVTIGDYLSRHPQAEIGVDHPDFQRTENDARQRIDRILGVNGKRSVTSLHRELGKIMIDHCGISRNQEGLREALRLIPDLRRQFWSDVRVSANGASLNQSLEHAGRVADFLEFAELMCCDALSRDESCGCHFRVEHQTTDGEALRDDDNFAHVSVWEHAGEDQPPELHKEPLHFEALPLMQRDYKT